MLTVQEIQKATHGVLLQGDGHTVVRGVSIDSRTLRRGDVFIAVQGKRLDGHKFLSQAVEKGASALVVSKRVSCPPSIGLIRVQDTTKALGELAQVYRMRWRIPVIAVTGSAGKTTTKEMIAAVLGMRYKTLKNVKTENNQYGVPLTLFRLNQTHEAAVLELGTNQPGDIRWLTHIASPTAAVFTNIGESHLEKLRTPEGVFREKFQMVKGMPERSCVIWNQDDRYLKKMVSSKSGFRWMSYGLLESADYRARDIRLMDNRRLSFKVGAKTFTLATPAEHQIYNALAAIACGRLLKIRYDDIASALRKFSFQGGRQQMIKSGGVTIIDDTYNANPVSFRGAVKTLDGLKTKGRKIIIAADMLELGSKTKSLHRQIGRRIAQSGVDEVMTVGPRAQDLAEAVAQANPRIRVARYERVEDLHQDLNGFCRPGDIVLVKGSRGMRMERTVAYIQEHLRKRGG